MFKSFTRHLKHTITDSMATSSSSLKRKGILESEEVSKKPRSRIDTSDREDSESSKSDAVSDATNDVSISNEDDEYDEDNHNTDYFEDEPLPHLDTDEDPFNLLDITDTTQHTLQHVNRIFLLDKSLVPDGEPTGVVYEEMTRANYPNVDASILNNEHIPFLIRNCALDFIKFFADLKNAFDKKGRFGNVGKVIRGPAGAGKSYVLYHVVHFCRASGWLVLYIPRAGEVSGLHEAMAARNILNNFMKAEGDKLKTIKIDKTYDLPISSYFDIQDQSQQGLSLYDCIRNGFNNPLATLEKVFDVVLNAELKYPVLVAIDEWNARCSPQNVGNRVLNLFAKNKLRSGFWLYAISSSFDPYEEFRNADAQTIMVDIPSYDMDEFSSILRCQHKFKRLPEDADADQIRYHSGLVPWMIFFWCEAWHTRLGISLREIRDDTGGPQKRIEVHFRSRTLLGEPQDKLWKITLIQAIEQTLTLNAIPTLEPGTLVILKKGHSVADLLAYSTDCELYFIQISLSPYNDHRSKVTDLKKPLIRKKKGTNTRSPSIIKYYMSLCRTKGGTRRFPEIASLDLRLNETLPKGVHYVYITTSDTMMTT
ncbi:1386_t:CDS:2, partial [Paraglomus occultum]